jgi:hypothetical protein
MDAGISPKFHAHGVELLHIRSEDITANGSRPLVESAKNSIRYIADTDIVGFYPVIIPDCVYLSEPDSVGSCKQ